MKRALFAAALLFSLSSLAFAASKPAEPSGSEPKKDEGPLSSATFAGLALRSIGPALTSGRISRPRRRPDRQQGLVGRSRFGRRLEDDQRRHHLERRSSTAKAPTRSAPSPSTRRTPTSSGSAPARTTTSAASPTATASTAPSTAASRGRAWGSRSPSTSAGSSSTRATRGSSGWRPTARCGAAAASAASTRAPISARPGRRRSRSATTPASPTSCSTRATRTRSTPPRTSAAATSGRSSAADPSRRSTSRSTAARAGASSTSGLPKGDIGRIGLALSPQNPDVLYAIVEAEADQGGFFRSTDRGESWEKRSGHSTSGNYYTEIFADPHQFDRIYSMDTFLQVSDDGGKSFRGLGEKSKHVDNHAIWVDPQRRRPLPRRLRRRPLRELRPRRHLALLRQPPDHPVLPRRRRHGAAVLQRLRRHPGQLHALRTVAHRSFPGTGQRGLGDRPGWRRLLDRRPIRPTRTSSTPRRSTASSPASTAGAARTSTSSRSRAPARRRCAGTGTRRWCSRRTRRPGSTSPPTGSSAATTAATAGRAISPDSDAPARPQPAEGDGPDPAARRRWRRTPRPRSTATSSRSPSRRSRRACSTSAPTTA